MVPIVPVAFLLVANSALNHLAPNAPAVAVAMRFIGHIVFATEKK
jgi:hypothetical protein